MVLRPTSNEAEMQLKNLKGGKNVMDYHVSLYWDIPWVRNYS